MNPPDQERLFREKLVSGAKWATAIRVLSQSLSWIVTLGMVRLLTPHDYGLNAMLEAPIELLMLFSTLGIDVAIIRYGQRNISQLSAAFGALLLVNSLFFLATLLSAGMIAEYFNEPQLKPILQVTAIIFVLSPFRTIPNALLDMALDFKLKSQVEMTGTIIASVISLILALLGAGVWALVAAILINATVRAVLLAYLRPWLVRPAFSWQLISELLKYGMVIVAGGVVGVLGAKSISFLAGPLLGTTILGYFAVASVFAMLPLSKVMPIVQQIMFPAFAHLREQPDKLKNYLLKSLELASLIIFPLSIGLATVATQLVHVVFGPDWIPITSALAILASLGPIRLTQQIFIAPLNATGHASIVMKIQLLNLVVLASSAMYAASYGLSGLVILVAASVSITLVVTLLVANRILRTTIADVFSAVFPALLSSAIMAGGILQFRYFYPANGFSVGNLLLEVAMGGLVYALVFYVAFRKKFNEIKSQFEPPSA